MNDADSSQISSNVRNVIHSHQATMSIKDEVGERKHRQYGATNRGRLVLYGDVERIEQHSKEAERAEKVFRPLKYRMKLRCYAGLPEAAPRQRSLPAAARSALCVCSPFTSVRGAKVEQAFWARFTTKTVYWLVRNLALLCSNETDIGTGRIRAYLATCKPALTLVQGDTHYIGCARHSPLACSLTPLIATSHLICIAPRRRTKWGRSTVSFVHLISTRWDHFRDRD